MGQVTRTKQLGYIQPPDTANHVIYTVPAGMTTIVKEICMWNGTGSTANIEAIVQPSGASTNYQVAFETVTDASLHRVSSWTVLGPGDELIVTTTVALVKVYVSGAELSGVAP